MNDKNIKIDIFFLKFVKTNTKKEKLEKVKKEKMFLLTSEIIGNRALSVCKTKIPTEYRAKSIRCFKN